MTGLKKKKKNNKKTHKRHNYAGVHMASYPGFPPRRGHEASVHRKKKKKKKKVQSFIGADLVWRRVSMSLGCVYSQAVLAGPGDSKGLDKPPFSRGK